MAGVSTPLELTVGGQPVRVFFERKAPTAWAEDPDGNLLPAVLAYKFGWLDFPVSIPGALRLCLELAIFVFATWALFSIRAVPWSLALGGLVLLHYALSYDRVAWLLGSR